VDGEIRTMMHIFALTNCVRVDLYSDRIIIVLLSIIYTFRHCSNCKEFKMKKITRHTMNTRFKFVTKQTYHFAFF